MFTHPIPSPSLLARVGRSPAGLLLLVGGFLGLNFPLGKLAGAAGVPPLLWAATISTSAALTLGFVLALGRRRVALDLRHLRYFGIAALVSYALPNALIFAAIPHLGSAYAAILFTLSPMLTVVLSAAARLRAPRRLEFAGIAIGFVGALLVASARGEIGREVEWIWIGVGLLVPLSLAIGNVYRTIDLPPRAAPLVLAVGSNLASAILLLGLAWATGDLALPTLAAIPGIVAIQVLASAGMFALFFQLQLVGGPVTLSQIGTVAAGVGVLAGTLGLGERYPAIVWIGVGIIAAGIALTVRARQTERLSG